MEGWRVASLAFKHKYLELFEDYLQDKDNTLLEQYMNIYIGKEIVKQLRFLIELARQEGHPSFAMDLCNCW